MNSCAMSDTPSVGTLTHFANHGNIKSVPRHTPYNFEFLGTLISGSEPVGDEHRRKNRNYLVGANRTFDLAGSLAPIGAPSQTSGDRKIF